MTKITYIEHNGKEHTIDVQNGLTVMEGAVQNDIPGMSFCTAPSITVKPFCTSTVCSFPLFSMYVIFDINLYIGIKKNRASISTCPI